MQRTGHFKMVLLGEQGAGKSSLALRFAKGYYHDNVETTIGAAFLTHTLQIDQETSMKVELWDTAGQERYHSLAPMYYRGAQAALIVFDVTHSDSFRRAKGWVKELRQANTGNVVIGLAGNKSDLATVGQRQVEPREVTEYADENNLIFMETSAKRGDNVNEIFMSIAKQVAITHPMNKTIKGEKPFPPGKPIPKENGGCCGNDSN